MAAIRLLKFPKVAMVVMIGASGSGKSRFARTHFLSTEVVSSDVCRGLVCDDENDQTATKAAFEILHLLVTKRLEAGRLTVVDATNVEDDPRAVLVDIARRCSVAAHAVVFRLPAETCEAHNRLRQDRQLPAEVIRRQSSQMSRSVPGLENEGFAQVHSLRSVAEVDAVVVERT